MIPLNEDAMIAIKALYSRTLPVDAYQFGDFRLDCGRFELLRNDHVIRLERKPMESLILLLASDGQLATPGYVAPLFWLAFSLGFALTPASGISQVISLLTTLP
jgi:DNA-binding response OmpR family regulator